MLSARSLHGSLPVALAAALLGAGCLGGSARPPHGYASDYSSWAAEGGPVADGSQPFWVDQSAEQLPARLLTAGLVADADARDEYREFMQRHGSATDHYGLHLARRVRVTVVDSRGAPVNDARVVLGLGQGEPIEGRTHADGVVDFHPDLYLDSGSGVGTVTVTVGSTALSAPVELPGPGRDGELVFPLPFATDVPASVDLGFLIDVTGSMGDELRYVNHEVGSIVRRIRDAVPGADIRVGATLYRDRGDATPLQVIPFTRDVDGFASVLSSIDADGGGDYPEDLYAGLETALEELEWHSGNAVRVLAVIADAPPQEYGLPFDHVMAIERALADGIRLLPVAASGANRDVELLFRGMGEATSTPYVYLTDDSGIGAPHLEADTDRVTVELFNDLLTRLVIDDLLGRGMHAPEWPGEPVASG